MTVQAGFCRGNRHGRKVTCKSIRPCAFEQHREQPINTVDAGMMIDRYVERLQVTPAVMDKESRYLGEGDWAERF